MTHLTAAQIVDAAEGRPDAGLRQHLIECDRCRDEVARAAAMLGTVRADDVPEPSPMFWQHFSRRVREAIDAETVAPLERPTRRWLWIPAAAAFATVIAIVGVRTVRAPQPPQALSVPSTSATSASAAADPLVATASDDGDWAIVAASAEGIEWEERAAAGLTVRPGAAERAVAELTSDQREELARLLREEIGSL